MRTLSNQGLLPSMPIEAKREIFYVLPSLQVTATVLIALLTGIWIGRKSIVSDVSCDTKRLGLIVDDIHMSL